MMDREKWRYFGFIEENNEVRIKEWRCPHCDEGYLKIKKLHKTQSPDSASEYDRLWSKANSSEHPWELDDELTKALWGRFSLHLTCTNCSGITLCLGDYKGEVGYEPVEDEENEGYEIAQQYLAFNPLFIDPGLKIIEIPLETPQTVEDNLEKSFSLFFFDHSASANRIRVALERLMDELKVPKFPGKRRHKKYRLKLHNRIEIFGKRNSNKYADEANRLIAVKWIGNDGSHSETSRESVLDAYLLFENVLKRIYSKDEAQLAKVEKKYVKRKGSPR